MQREMTSRVSRYRGKPRLLIFIVAFDAEKTIRNVITRVPSELSDLYDIQILIIDDASSDSTFIESYETSRTNGSGFPIRVLLNPVNQGYGGNQKLGYHYAIEHGFDFVALVHGDGQYAPECLPELLEPLRHGEADAVFGSRMLAPGSALAGGMPLYKFVGNKILTWIENRALDAKMSEFHSGYRIYSVASLRAIPFDRNSNKFHFDTEVIIQLLIARRSIKELPIPTYYGDEICHVNGIQYAANVLLAVLKARLQKFGLFYDPRFDCAPDRSATHYTLKEDYDSPHSIAMERVHFGARVLDVGCAGGYLGSRLRVQKRCFVKGLDREPVRHGVLDECQVWDLNTGLPSLGADRYDIVLLLDVIEHLSQPEAFLEDLRQKFALSSSTEFMISTANVAFFVTRAMLLLGQFNYGPRGILDITHTRLFTFSSLRRTLLQAGFCITESKGIPAPYPLAIGEGFISRALLAINQMLIGMSRGLFSYQIFMRVRLQPTLELLLSRAEQQSNARASLIEMRG
jgi:glycosyltransferase involved in cell wall biosynthesis